MADKTDIWVYAHWKGMDEPKCIGILSAQQAKDYGLIDAVIEKRIQSDK